MEPATPEGWSSKMAALILFCEQCVMCGEVTLASWQGIVPPDDIRRRIRLTRGMLERDILGAMPRFSPAKHSSIMISFYTWLSCLQLTSGTPCGSTWFFDINTSRQVGRSSQLVGYHLARFAEVVRSPFTESQEVR